jgi:hypothetical protein
VGVLLKQERKRGRFYTTTPESLAALPLRPQAESAPGQPVTTTNYGPAADGLRRDLRVAQVRCLAATAPSPAS